MKTTFFGEEGARLEKRQLEERWQNSAKAPNGIQQATASELYFVFRNRCEQKGLRCLSHYLEWKPAASEDGAPKIDVVARDEGLRLVFIDAAVPAPHANQTLHICRRNAP